jgi:excisionase family DNA binding protein
MSEELLKVEEAAKILRVRRETIRRYIKAGHLKAVALPGGDYRLYQKDIMRLLTCSQKEGRSNGQ